MISARLWAVPAMVAWVAGCYGQVGSPARERVDGGGPGGDPGTGMCNASEPDPGPTPIRRLSRAEYDATVKDLLHVTTTPAADFPADPEVLGFDNNAAALWVTPDLAERISAAAETLATSVNLDGLLPCSASDGAACARQFIATFGKRAFRRPLTDAEIDLHRQVYDVGAGQDGFDAGIRLVVRAMLQSPSFLYRAEVGQPGNPGDVVPLTPYETASRLSYLIWGSMPDDALFAAAEVGTLATATGIAAEARRLLEDPRARATVANFHARWLQLEEIIRAEKDPTLFPGYPTLAPLFKKEAEVFLDHVFWEAGGNATRLYDSGYTFMNKPLADFYGVAGPTGDAFVKVPVDPSTRGGGLLTQAGFLASHAKSNQSSPVARGVFVRRRVLCQELPDPPPNISIAPPDPDPKLTTRERFAEHTRNTACSTCHSLIDPVGFGFEGYDAIGRVRTVENGKAVDTSGQLTSTEDADGPFNGAVDLARRLSQSREAKRCVATQWFRFAAGRAETPLDACSIKVLEKRFADANYDARELVVALTQTPAFLYRRLP